MGNVSCLPPAVAEYSSLYSPNLPPIFAMSTGVGWGKPVTKQINEWNSTPLLDFAAIVDWPPLPPPQSNCGL